MIGFAPPEVPSEPRARRNGSDVDVLLEAAQLSAIAAATAEHIVFGSVVAYRVGVDFERPVGQDRAVVQCPLDCAEGRATTLGTLCQRRWREGWLSHRCWSYQVSETLASLPRNTGGPLSDGAGGGTVAPGPSTCEDGSGGGNRSYRAPNAKRPKISSSTSNEKVPSSVWRGARLPRGTVTAPTIADGAPDARAAVQ